MEQKHYIIGFEEATKDVEELIGSKALNLALLYQQGFPVPYGFIVSNHTFDEFLQINNLKRIISRQISGIKTDDDIANVSHYIMQLVVNGKFSVRFIEEIKIAYTNLCGILGYGNVAVRSSGILEDTLGFSFAGIHDTFLNISGQDALLENIKLCFASAFSTRALEYRLKKGMPIDKWEMAVIVQAMCNAICSGVVFTSDIRNSNNMVATVEGAWGLGEIVVQGKVIPDRYFVDKTSGAVIERLISTKEYELISTNTGEVSEIRVCIEKADKPVLTDNEVSTLVKYAVQIERFFGAAQDIEWAKDQNSMRLTILQARPITVLMQTSKKSQATNSSMPTIITGFPASPGKALGIVRVVLNLADLASFNKGEILVTKMTSMDWVPLMQKASAVITDAGGLTCHAAIICRELGIPCIVGAKNATDILSGFNRKVMVDAYEGIVYEIDDLGESEFEQLLVPKGSDHSISAPLVSSFDILWDFRCPPAEKYDLLPHSSITARLEYIYRTEIGVHPLYLVETNQTAIIAEHIKSYLIALIDTYHPKKLLMWLPDIRSDEYRRMLHSEAYEKVELNPSMGIKGCSRYLKTEFKSILDIEKSILEDITLAYDIKDAGIIVPHCRSIKDAQAIKQLIGGNFQVWCQFDLPIQVVLVSDFIKTFDGIIINTDKILRFLLGIDDFLIGNQYKESFESSDNLIASIIDAAGKEKKPVYVLLNSPITPEKITMLKNVTPSGLCMKPYSSLAQTC